MLASLAPLSLTVRFPKDTLMVKALYILVTIVLVLVYPIIQYLIKGDRWKKIAFYVYISCAVLYVAAMIYIAVSSYHLESAVTSLKEYSSVACLDALGNPSGFGYGGDLKYNSPLTRMLEGTFNEKSDQLHMSRDQEAEAKYRAVIKKFPKFPFAYYFLALCLRDRGDPCWRDYATKAIVILEKTTTIDGHHRHHDEVLRRLRDYLGEKGET
jgi:Ca2+/Na+ antiporter